MHRVKINRDRPDFRVFVDLLYGFGRNVDTDGDSTPVHSRSWRYLYIKDRESNDPGVEIVASESDPTAFEVVSGSAQLEELAALYLCMSAGSTIFLGENELSADAIEGLKQFHATPLLRAEQSIWHKSSSETPYPNQASSTNAA